jgi:hypothetical protein
MLPSSVQWNIPVFLLLASKILPTTTEPSAETSSAKVPAPPNNPSGVNVAWACAAAVKDSKRTPNANDTSK